MKFRIMLRAPDGDRYDSRVFSDAIGTVVLLQADGVPVGRALLLSAEVRADGRRAALHLDGPQGLVEAVARPGVVVSVAGRRRPA